MYLFFSPAEIFLFSDQWAPFNPEGKKKYDKDFLLALKNDPKSKRKPDNIQPDVYVGFCCFSVGD